MREIGIGLLVIIVAILMLGILWILMNSFYHFIIFRFEGIESIVDFFWIDRGFNSFSLAIGILITVLLLALTAGAIGNTVIDTLGLYEDEAEDQQSDKLVDECVSDEDIDKIVDDVVYETVEKRGNKE